MILKLKIIHRQVEAIDKYFKEQVGCDLPPEISVQLNNLANRVAQIH